MLNIVPCSIFAGCFVRFACVVDFLRPQTPIRAKPQRRDLLTLVLHNLSCRYNRCDRAVLLSCRPAKPLPPSRKASDTTEQARQGHRLKPSRRVGNIFFIMRH
ncbi:Hypothetical protein, putative [Bodo saltans]|uniref:Uncharacterized protein n=1 Tax=Bodo saltans TaxID=75058 RepID=A0A0S4JE39_BODSA|nr:Hypothetical protein, putative [Bodo saltans]|eukprot:CUG87694.1 Hypothetical protein, putative [Bodo saltans]